ncbi:hypothetical protein PINS_up016505 [Pythium insidiosum]|nr:hypothetical protein PINS_up016505 [Pythium insidiosum]
MLFGTTSADLLVFESLQLGEFTPASPNDVSWITAAPVTPTSFPPFTVAPYTRMNSKLRRTSNVVGITAQGGVYSPPVQNGDVWLTWSVIHYAYSGEPNLQLDASSQLMDALSATGDIALSFTIWDFQPKAAGNWLLLKLRVRKPLQSPAVTNASPQPGITTRRVFLSDRLYVDHEAFVLDDSSATKPITLDLLAEDSTAYDFGLRVPVRLATTAMTHYLRFSSLQIQPSSLMYLSPAVTFLSGVEPATTAGAFFASISICLSGVSCGAQQGTVLVTLENMVEYDPVGNADTAQTTQGFDVTSAVVFTETNGAMYDNSPSPKVRKWTLSAVAPFDGVNGVAASTSGSASEAAFTCTVQHFNRGGADNFYRWRFKLPVYPGSVEVRYRITGWTPLANTNVLKLKVRLRVDDSATSIEEGTPPGPDVRLFKLGGNRGVVVPTLAYNPTLMAHTSVDVSVDPSSGSNDAVLTVAFTDIQNDLEFALLFVAESMDPTGLAYPPAPQIALPTPAPTPFFPAPVPAPSTPIANTNLEPGTKMNVYPNVGVVEVCFSPDCNGLDGSLSFALDRLWMNAAVNQQAPGELNATQLMDLQDVQFNGFDLWATEPTADDTFNTSFVSSTIRALGCVSRCAARTMSAAEFTSVRRPERDDSVAVAVEFQHLWASQTIHSTFENTRVPYGGVLLNVSVRVASSTQLPLAGVALTLLVAATEDGGPCTNVSLSQPFGTMYLQRVHLGSRMYLDIPTYATADDHDVPVSVTARAVTTGAHKDLVEVSIVLGSTMQSNWTSASGVSSSNLFGSHSPTPGNSGPSSSSSSMASMMDEAFGRRPTGSDGRVLTTRMLPYTQGTFAFCGDPDCGRNAFIKFSGLSSTEGVTVRRFPGSTALQFASPSRTVRSDGVATLASSLNAWVPQSRVRPLVRYDAAKASAYSDDALFGATIEQFLAPSMVSYAGHALFVPRGAVKFSLSLSRWPFVSTTDRLVVDVALSSLDVVTGDVRTTFTANTTMVQPDGPASRTLVVTANDGMTLELPMRALVDGAVVSIDASVISRFAGDWTVSLTFPPFQNSLEYDPVVATKELQAAMVRRGQRPRRRVRSWVASGVLYGVLGHALLLSAAHCAKHLRWKAPDLSSWFD